MHLLAASLEPVVTTRRRPSPAVRPAASSLLAGGAATRSRVAVAGAALVLAAGLAGCSVTNPMTTQNNYDASDGVSVELGDLTLRNLLVLTSAEGAPGTVLGALTNDGSDAARVSIAVAGEQAGRPVPVDGRATVVVGPESEATVDVDAVPAAPGDFLELEISSDLGGTSTVQVPVLDGTLPEYADLVPDAEG